MDHTFTNRNQTNCVGFVEISISSLIAAISHFMFALIERKQTSTIQKCINIEIIFTFVIAALIPAWHEPCL